MGWVGGHFSEHWDLQKDVREKLFIDELDLIHQDIKKIEREIKNQQSKGEAENEITELQAVLEVARKDKKTLIAQQKSAIEQDPELEANYKKMSRKYQQAIAKSAVSCCLRIAVEVAKIEDADGLQKLKMGIGTGPVLVGNFGSSDQIAFTVLGPTVNRAARLEPASAQMGCNILVDDNTHDLLKDNEAFMFRKVPRISVKGIDNDLITFEPFFANQVTQPFLDKFNEGGLAIEEGKNKQAIACFKEANELRTGGDTASRLWLEFAKEAIASAANVGTISIKK